MKASRFDNCFNFDKIIKEDSKTAFTKVQMLKMQGKARFPLKDGNYVELDPVKQGATITPQN